MNINFMFFGKFAEVACNGDQNVHTQRIREVLL
ncbi:hypothetical protein VV93_v1c45590 (plasmid) [Vibrio vulnificus]|nr:hypothetical protein VV93_v1c45590 [Vibrio vulnificus]